MSNNISLAAARTRANVTQSDAARKMDVSVQTMWKWEKGIAPVARRHWARLASLLRVKEDELEEILVQTLLDACLSNHDSRPLRNAQASRLYRSDLLFAALAEFENAAAPYQYQQNQKQVSDVSPAKDLTVYPSNPQAAKGPMAEYNFERRQLEYEKIIVGLKNELGETKMELGNTKMMLADLERENARLRRELEQKRPAVAQSLSSALNHNPSANEVERTEQVEEFSSEVKT